MKHPLIPMITLDTKKGIVESFDRYQAMGRVRVENKVFRFCSTWFDSGLPRRFPIRGELVEVWFKPGTESLVRLKAIDEPRLTAAERERCVQAGVRAALRALAELSWYPRPDGIGSEIAERAGCAALQERNRIWQERRQARWKRLRDQARRSVPGSSATRGQERSA